MILVFTLCLMIITSCTLAGILGFLLGINYAVNHRLDEVSHERR